MKLKYGQNANSKSGYFNAADKPNEGNLFRQPTQKNTYSDFMSGNGLRGPAGGPTINTGQILNEGPQRERSAGRGKAVFSEMHNQQRTSFKSLA